MDLVMRLVGALNGLAGGLAKLLCLTAGLNGVRSPLGVIGLSCWMNGFIVPSQPRRGLSR